MSLWERDILTVNGESARSVAGRDRAVVKVVIAQDALEIRFGWSTEQAVEVTSRIGIENLSGSKKLLLIGDGGDQRVMCNRRLRLVRIKNEQS